ncbi:MAG: MCE family protein [Acidimicrobiales bacterium]|nr:MCE family protein [Acidimicrobiales bacterium]
MGDGRTGRLPRALVALAVTATFALAATVAVRWSYGAYDDGYQLVGRFPHAGQGLVPGSDVKYRGVNVGEVDSIRLVDREAEIRFTLDPGFRVPEGVTVVVRPKTIFGEKFLDLSFPEGAPGPYLEAGDEVTDTRAATEVEDLFAAAQPLFEAIDEQELAELVASLTRTADGLGDDVADAWRSGAATTALLNRTLDDQLRALRSWRAFQESIRTIGGDLNAIAAHSNEALPTFNQARADFHRALESLRGFGDRFADLLAGVRPDLDRVLISGDNVMRVLVAHEDDIADVVDGLAAYVSAFGGGLSAERLPDGSGFAYFKNFIYLDDLRDVLCTALADTPPQFSAFRDAVLSLGGPIDCSSYFSPSGSPLPAPLPAGAAGRPAAAQQLADDLYGLTAVPDQSGAAPVSVLVDNVLRAAGVSGPEREATP